MASPSSVGFLIGGAIGTCLSNPVPDPKPVAVNVVPILASCSNVVKSVVPTDSIVYDFPITISRAGKGINKGSRSRSIYISRHYVKLIIERYVITRFKVVRLRKVCVSG